MSRLLPSRSDLSLGDRDPRVVGVDEEDADQLLAALSSETARNALSELHEEPATTSELADRIDTSLQNVQYHLSNLRDADVVEVVDTVYSEKGREMNVYAPADEPLVLFAGRSTDSSGIKTALKRLLGGYGVLGLAAIGVQRMLSVAPPGEDDPTFLGQQDDAEVEPTAGDVEEPDADTEAGAEAVQDTPSPDAEALDTDERAFDGALDPETVERAELAAEYAVSMLEPGVVFFLGAALVFSLVWVYWYRSRWRKLS